MWKLSEMLRDELREARAAYRDACDALEHAEAELEEAQARVDEANEHVDDAERTLHALSPVVQEPEWCPLLDRWFGVVDVGGDMERVGPCEYRWQAYQASADCAECAEVS